MRALTYNLMQGEDDDAVRFEGAMALLAAAAPDVLVLNEAGLLAQDGGGRLRELERVLGMRGVLAEAASGYHVALLVRGATIARVQVLSAGFVHVALIAAIQSSRLAAALQVAAAHLAPFSADARASEVAMLLQHLSASRSTLLMGDLNALSPRDVQHTHAESWPSRYRSRHFDASGKIDTRAIELLEQRGLVDLHAALHDPTSATRPTRRYARPDRPSQRLDYIFASRDLAALVTRCAPFDHELAQSTSDHLPLFADFEAL